MKYFPVWFALVALLSACGGTAHKKLADETVQNPYTKRVKTLADAGIFAMRTERRDYARNMFARALKEAQLTDDLHLVAKQWYNLGTANAAMEHYQEALHDFDEARAVAERVDDPTGMLRARLAWALLPGQADKPENKINWQPDVLAAKFPVDMHLMAARLAQKQQRQGVAKLEYDVVLKKSDNSRSGLLYRGQAYLGLAILAGQKQDMQQAKLAVEKSLRLLRQVGSPRLIAHALLFYGKLDIATTDRRDALQRALVIYRALEDSRGQRDCLTALVEIETGNTSAAKAYQHRINSLQEGLD